MTEAYLRTLHRRVGIVFVVLIVIQTISGVFLDLTWFITPHDFINRIGITDGTVHETVQRGWEWVLRSSHQIHLGGLIKGAVYRTVLSVALLFLSVTGLRIFTEERKRMRPKSH